LITQIQFGEEYRSSSSSLCSFLHTRYFVPLRPKYPLNTLLYLQPMFHPQCDNQVSQPYKKQAKL
jgi:hypothetical protein